MRRLAKFWMTAAITCMGMCTAIGLADEAAINSTDDAKAIYGAFLGQWKGKEGAPLQVSSKAAEPTPEEIKEYDECASGKKGGSVRWARSTSDIELKAALSSFVGVKLVDAKEWEAADPGDLIAKGKPVDAAVRSGFDRGLMTLSAISFNETHDIAMFSYSFTCGSLCGNGGTLMFNRTPGGWVQNKRRCSSWLS